MKIFLHNKFVFLYYSFRLIKQSANIYRKEISRQTILGFFWPTLKLLLLPVFAYVTFGNILGVQSGFPGISYRLYVLSGLIPWMLLLLMISGTNRFWGTSNRRKSLLGANTYFTHLILGIIYSYWFIFLALLTYLWFQEFEVWGFESSSIRFACYILLLLIFVWFSVYIFWFCGLLVALARDFKQLLALTSTGLLLLSPIYFQFQSPDSNLEKILQSLNVFGHFIEFSHQVLFASSFQVNSKFLYLLFPLCVILMSIILKNFRLHVESAIIRISQVDKSEDFE